MGQNLGFGDSSEVDEGPEIWRGGSARWIWKWKYWGEVVWEDMEGRVVTCRGYVCGEGAKGRGRG